MSVKVSTELLKKSISNVVKGVSKNNLFPITSLIGISTDVENQKLHLYSTDNANYVKISCKAEVEDEFDICISADIFSKLIFKLSADIIELEYENSTLTINGNGVYTFSAISDEEGNVVFPKIIDEVNIDESSVKSIDAIILHNIININKASITKDFTRPSARGYLFDEEKITTATSSVACFNVKSTFNESILVSPELMDLVAIFPESIKINYVINDEDMYFYNDDKSIVIYGPKMSGIESYPDLSTFYKLEYPYCCKVSKSVLSNALDRILLFVEELSQYSANFIFSSNQITLISTNNATSENVSYISPISDDVEFSGLINVSLLKSQVDSLPGNNIFIYFGQDKTISIATEAEDIKKVIVLVDL